MKKQLQKFDKVIVIHGYALVFSFTHVIFESIHAFHSPLFSTGLT